MNEKGRGSTQERGGADGRPRNENFSIGLGDHTGSPLRRAENAQKKRANWPKTAAQNTAGPPQKVKKGSHKTPAKRVLRERGGADHKVNLRGKAAK